MRTFMGKMIWYWEFASENPEWVEIEGKHDLVELVIVRAGDVYMEFCYVEFWNFPQQICKICFINMTRK